jgi:hypothetical protein
MICDGVCGIGGCIGIICAVLLYVEADDTLLRDDALLLLDALVDADEEDREERVDLLLLLLLLLLREERSLSLFLRVRLTIL